MSQWTGLDVYLPDGRKLGVVHDAVLDADNMQCTHVFVRDTPEQLVEEAFLLRFPGDGYVPSTTSCCCVGSHPRPSPSTHEVPG